MSIFHKFRLNNGVCPLVVTFTNAMTIILIQDPNACHCAYCVPIVSINLVFELPALF